jgi:anti-sigma factor RsiW
MECLEPGMVKPEDHVAYVAGEADDRTVAHVAACSACAAQAAAYAETDQILQSSLFRVDCPPAQTLGELVLQMLDPEEAFVVRSHLALCPYCRDEFSTLDNALHDDPLADLKGGRN